MKKISAPLINKEIEALEAGDSVLISGTIYTARDAAHKRLEKEFPFDPKGQIIFYASPTPTPKGKIIGSIGPTTSSRMDAFAPALLEKGIKGMIGKGARSPEVIASIKKNQAVYFIVPGGVAALLSRHVKKSAIIAYPELDPEAVLKLEVLDFPAIVAIDSKGKSLFNPHPAHVKPKS